MVVDALHSKQISQAKMGLVILFTIVIAQKIPNLTPEIQELANITVSTVFSRMRTLVLDDVATAIDLLDFIDQKRADKFLDRLQEMIEVTHIKLLIQPSVISLIKILTTFHFVKNAR